MMEFLQSRWITCMMVSLFYWYKLTLCAKTCPKVKIPNGSARVKSNGRRIEFRCNSNFQLVGVKLAICHSSGKWSQIIPSCVGTTCQQPAQQKQLIVESLYKGGVLKFACDAGLTRSGPETIMCDGKKWTSQPPKCIEAVTLDCDFENENLCGWNQDKNDDFDWIWIKGETPTANTGPRFDHTTNSSEGHYLFLESSAPQKPGQKTRLISPPHVSSNMSIMCLEFFYHMFGPDGIGEVGNLDVYVGPQVMSTKSLTRANNVFHRSGNQGDQWIHAEVQIPQQSDAFIIVLQGTKLQSWSGDISLDDVKVYQCLEKLTTSSGFASVDSTTQSQQNTTYRPKSSSTIFPSATAIRKTKLPKQTMGSRTTLPPTTNVVSPAATFTQARQTSKALFTATSIKWSPFDNDYGNYTTSTKSYVDSNNEDRYNYFKQTTTDAKTGVFPNLDDKEDSNKENSNSSSSNNISVGNSESKTPFTDCDEATSPEECDGLPDERGSSGSIALLPLIVGIVASAVVGIVVTVIMIYIWVRNQREKQDKHQEDQMNIMSDYIETNLCT